MVYTVTVNPSLDYIVDVDKFNIGEVNRTKSQLIFPGGKGINVSIVLNNLEIENTAYGFIAGFTGDEIARRLGNMGVKTDFIRLEHGNSRINLTLRNVEETSINGIGAVCSENEQKNLMDKLSQASDDDIIVLSGSVPNGISDKIYEEIMKMFENRSIKIVVDVTRKYMEGVLKYRPFLIKPNQSELEEIFDVKIKSTEEIICYAKKLQNMGARNVLVSRGGEGAVLYTENNELFVHNGIKGNVINTIGAGDSMVAGFLAGYLKKQNMKEAFYMGIAAGTASAFSDNLATCEQIETIYERVLDFS